MCFNCPDRAAERATCTIRLTETMDRKELKLPRGISGWEKRKSGGMASVRRGVCGPGWDFTWFWHCQTIWKDGWNWRPHPDQAFVATHASFLLFKPESHGSTPKTDLGITGPFYLFFFPRAYSVNLLSLVFTTACLFSWCMRDNRQSLACLCCRRPGLDPRVTLPALGYASSVPN